jgi:hypothetical protein
MVTKDAVKAVRLSNTEVIDELTEELKGLSKYMDTYNKKDAELTKLIAFLQ